MRRTLMCIVVIILALSLGLLMPGCYGQQIPTGDTNPAAIAESDAADIGAVIQQMPGVVDSVAEIIRTAPGVDTQTKDQILGYATFAKDASQAGASLATVKSPDQLGGAFTAVANLATAAPLDAATRSQIDNYVGWGAVLLKTAGILAPLIL
jgi:hypothetical protein